MVNDPIDQTVVPPPNNTPYIIAVVAMSFASVMAVSLVSIFRAGDNTAIITAIVGLTAPTIFSLLAFMKAQETHLSVNSRLDAFMKNARYAAHAQGVEEGRAAGRYAANERTDQLANDARARDHESGIVPPRSDDAR